MVMRLMALQNSGTKVPLEISYVKATIVDRSISDSPEAEGELIFAGY